MKTAFTAVLILFIIFGFVTKLILTTNFSLNSDSVGEGLLSMEIWDHQNYFLAGYYLPSQDNLLFTELLPFQLIPQILTGFSPTALKLMTFVELALGVAILSYVVYMVTGDSVCALVFAALAANVSPESYNNFWFPTSHGGTIVFLGIILALLLYMGRKGEAQTRRNRKGKTVRPAKIEWAYVAGLILLVALTVVSDTIILPWLIVPYILAYLLFVKEKSATMNLAVALMAVVSGIVYVFKTYFVYTWVSQDLFSPRTTADVSFMVALFFKALSLLLNPGLYVVVSGSAGFGALEAVSLLAFAALAVYAAKKALEDRARWPFYAVLLLSFATMFGMWLISHYTNGMDSTRYLTFTALAVFILIAMAYRPGDKLFYGLVVAMLLLSSAYYFVQASEFHDPNASEYKLISFLKDNGQTFGYGSYWNSNLLTYLSGDDVRVRAVFFYRDGMKPDVWLANEQWYRSTPARSFVLFDNSTGDANAAAVISALTTRLNASAPLHAGKYDIYPFQGYQIPQFQVQR